MTEFENGRRKEKNARRKEKKKGRKERRWKKMRIGNDSKFFTYMLTMLDICLSERVVS